MLSYNPVSLSINLSHVSHCLVKSCHVFFLLYANAPTKKSRLSVPGRALWGDPPCCPALDCPLHRDHRWAHPSCLIVTIIKSSNENTFLTAFFIVCAWHLSDTVALFKQRGCIIGAAVLRQFSSIGHSHRAKQLHLIEEPPWIHTKSRHCGS